MGARNDWEFRIFGMKRSGHHAVIVWVACHFPPKSVCFINDAEPFRDPFSFHSHTGATTSRGECFIHREEEQIATERAMHKKCLMYSYEDRVLSDFADGAAIPAKSETVGESRREFALLVLRDPFNTVASRLRTGWSDLQQRLDHTLDQWLAYAKEYAGLINCLRPKIPVSFNRWFADEPYRRSLSQSLGLAFTDRGLNRIAGNGDGSSWDGIALDGRAQEMKVLERWKHFMTDERFCKLFHGRDDIREMSEEIFGHMPGTEALFGARRREPRLRPPVRAAGETARRAN